VTIQCPHCGHSLELKGVRAGHFVPKCTTCREKFDLTISADESVAPVVRKPAASPHVAGTTAVIGASPGPSRASVSTASVTVAPPPSPAPGAPPAASAVSIGLGAGTVDVPPGATPQQPSLTVEDDETPVLHGNLGGYEIEKLLGKGGMGNVYLARQVSLDRDVALKTLSPRLASDPEFINRFTREAYAAAQLTHHNVVQIHDIGEARRTNFFSMEYVDGQSLGDVVKSEGAIDPETAAGYVLQAARGLKFAHDHGMVHRDVKPENLLLNDQGVVKVADLGLVKRAGAKDTITAGNAAPGAADVRTTQAHVFFGTPFYMAPEQAKDAANVDARADIYSLGCTLYALLTGRPPFTGKTVVEVLSKHAAWPVTPPEQISPRIAGPLSAIVQKMMAKKVGDRYQNLAQVIQELEEYLGVATAGPFRPKEEHVKVVSYAAERFNNATWARLRPKLIASFYVLCGLCAVASAFTFSDAGWRVGMTGGFVGFAILTTLIYLVTVGAARRTFEFRKARQLVWSAGPIEWLKWVVAIGITGFLLYSFGLLGSWILFGALATGVAIGFHFTVDLLAAGQRKAPVQQTESLVKQMRIKGLDENALRQFVCRYAGDEWEEFYEAIFGYEGKLTARRMWGKDDQGHDRRKHAAWRDAFVKWVDHKIERKKQLNEQKYLAKLEARALAAKGISEKVAARQAARNAERIVERASVVREESIQRAAETVAPTRTAKTLSELVVVVDPNAPPDHLAEPEEGQPGHKRQSAFRRRYGTPVDWVFGQKTRFVLAVLVLAGFAMWWNQNGGAVVKKEASETMGSRQEVTETVLKDPSKAITTVGDYDVKVRTNVPLKVKMVPEAITTAVGSWGGGVAGAILMLGAIFSARLVGFTVLLAAAVALFGPMLKLPVIETPAPWMCNIAAAGLALFGVFWFRGRPS
jgi:hypothetical protein